MNLYSWYFIAISNNYTQYIYKIYTNCGSSKLDDLTLITFLLVVDVAIIKVSSAQTIAFN